MKLISIHSDRQSTESIVNELGFREDNERQDHLQKRLAMSAPHSVYDLCT